jgi:uncharacterized membrane protein YqiK
MGQLINTIIILAIVAGLVAAAMFVLFYRRANKEVSFVRTGFGGEKVVMNNGSMVLPLVHYQTRVNMKTIEIPIKRIEEDSLITADKLRVDVLANFFVRVGTDIECVALAAQTLGEKTFDDDAMIDMLEERCQAALNAVVSKMEMKSLHTDKKEFRNLVQEFIKNDLSENGLTLQSVAITHVDQTAFEFFNKQNVFDSQGLTVLKKQIAENEKMQTDVETHKDIAIREMEYEAEKNAIDYEEKLAREEAEKRKTINDINQQTERDIEAARIAKERDVELFQQRKNIMIAEGQKKVAQTWIDTDKLKAEAARMSEEVTTAREKAQADRNRLVEVVSAEKEADRQRIIAGAAAEAEKLAAQAAEIRYNVEAAGKRAINEAANLLSNKQISMQVKMEIVKQLPDIVRESVRPLENIEGIKIMHVEGLGAVGGGGSNGTGSSGGDGSGNGSSGGGSFSDQLVNSALRFKAQAPLVDNLLKEVGLDGANINSITDSLQKDMKSEIPQSDQDDEVDIEKSA